VRARKIGYVGKEDAKKGHQGKQPLDGVGVDEQKRGERNIMFTSLGTEQ